jgi:hypothetical protein
MKGLEFYLQWDLGYLSRKLHPNMPATEGQFTNTIDRWNKHATTDSLPRSGPSREHTRAQECMLIRYARRFPKATYQDLEDLIHGVSFKRRKLPTESLRSIELPTGGQSRNLSYAQLRLKWCKKHRNAQLGGGLTFQKYVPMKEVVEKSAPGSLEPTSGHGIMTRLMRRRRRGRISLK